MRNLFLEKEMDTPKDWVSNIILERDGKGNVFEIKIEDDDEGGE